MIDYRLRGELRYEDIDELSEPLAALLLVWAKRVGYGKWHDLAEAYRRDLPGAAARAMASVEEPGLNLRDAAKALARRWREEHTIVFQHTETNQLFFDFYPTVSETTFLIESSGSPEQLLLAESVAKMVLDHLWLDGRMKLATGEFKSGKERRDLMAEAKRLLTALPAEETHPEKEPGQTPWFVLDPTYEATAFSAAF